MKLMSAGGGRAAAPPSTADPRPPPPPAPRPRTLRGRLEIENAKRGPEVPVRPGLEVERGRIAVTPHLGIVGRALPHRHARVRQVGQREQDHLALVLDRVELDLEL